MDKKVIILVWIMLLVAICPTGAYSIYVQVVSPDNEPVANVTVKAVNGTTVIATGTTNGTGWAELDVPNGTVVLVVDYNTTTDIIEFVTVTSAPNETFVLNMTTMPYVKIYSSPIKVNVTIIEENTKSEFVYVANETTIFTTSELNYTFPANVSEFPYRYSLKEIKYDGSTTTEQYVVLKPTTPTEIVASYERTWWITLSTEQLIIVLLSSVLMVLLLLAVAKAGAKVVYQRRKYWR